VPSPVAYFLVMRKGVPGRHSVAAFRTWLLGEALAVQPNWPAGV